MGGASHGGAGRRESIGPAPPEFRRLVHFLLYSTRDGGVHLNLEFGLKPPDLERTSWNRIAIRLKVPTTTGVYLLAAGRGHTPTDVLLVGSAQNLRARMLELLKRDDVGSLPTRVVHWVADLSVEQARLAERILSRRYDPPLGPPTRSRYHDILAG